MSTIDDEIREMKDNIKRGKWPPKPLKWSKTKPGRAGLWLYRDDSPGFAPGLMRIKERDIAADSVPNWFEWAGPVVIEDPE